MNQSLFGNVQGNKGEIVIYQTEDGQAALEVNLVEYTVWLSLNHMVALFDRDKSVISMHIKSIFGESELDKRSLVAKYATTASDGTIYAEIRKCEANSLKTKGKNPNDRNSWIRR